MANPYLRPVEEFFWPDGFSRNMWMILDTARDRRIYPMLIDSYMDYSCLYAGELAPSLARAAPYLVQLDFESRYTRRLIDQAWGQSWGVFLRSDLSMPKIRRHLRQFLRVRDPRGQFLVFRYYDPRVLRVYLPTCNSEELRTVFGPLESFVVEDENPATVLEFTREVGKLSTVKTPLVAQGKAV